MTRYLLFCAPFFYLAFAVALTGNRRKALPIATAGFLVAMNGFSLFGVYSNGNLHDLEGVYPRREYANMAKFMVDRKGAKDAIVHTLESTLIPVRYYTAEEIPTHFIIFPSRKESGLSFPGLENEEPIYPLKDGSKLKEYDRIWYVRGWWVQQGDQYDQATSPQVPDWLLKNNYEKVEGMEMSFNGGRITLYKKKR